MSIATKPTEITHKNSKSSTPPIKINHSTSTSGATKNKISHSTSKSEISFSSTTSKSISTTITYKPKKPSKQKTPTSASSTATPNSHITIPSIKKLVSTTKTVRSWSASTPSETFRRIILPRTRSWCCSNKKARRTIRRYILQISI